MLDPIARTVGQKVIPTKQVKIRERRKLSFTTRINTMPRKRKATDKFTKKKSNLKARICTSLSWASFLLRYCRIGVLFIPNHVREVGAHVQLLRYQDIQNHSKQIRKIENQMESKNKIPVSSPEIQLIKPLWNPDQGSTAKTKLCYMMKWDNWLTRNQVSKLWEKHNLTSLIHSSSASLILEEHRQMLKLHKLHKLHKIKA